MSVVIIPAYKPDERLIGIVDQLWTYGFRIVVVDDGSGEDYLDIFNRDIAACFLWTGGSRTPGECSWMRWQRCLRILAVRWLIILTAATVLLWK